LLFDIGRLEPARPSRSSGLAGQLADEALRAIAAHDHRTGTQSDALIADMLNLADALAVIDKRFGRERLKQADNGDPYVILRCAAILVGEHTRPLRLGRVFQDPCQFAGGRVRFLC